MEAAWFFIRVIILDNLIVVWKKVVARVGPTTRATLPLGYPTSCATPGHGFTRITMVRPLVRRTGIKATDGVIFRITFVAFVFLDLLRAAHTSRCCAGTQPFPSCAILPSCLRGETRERTELRVV